MESRSCIQVICAQAQKSVKKYVRKKSGFLLKSKEKLLHLEEKEKMGSLLSGNKCYIHKYFNRQNINVYMCISLKKTTLNL